MTKIPSLLALLCTALLATPAVVAAATFEGRVTMKVSGPRSTPPQMTFSLKEGFARIDLAAGSGQSAAVIFDAKESRMTMLMLDRKMYISQEMPKPPTGAAVAEGAAGTAVEMTTQKEKILGYDCVKYVARAREGVSEIWVTDQLGSFLGFGSGSNPMAGMGKAREGTPAAQGWEQALLGKGVFPLRVVTALNGKETFRMEATAVDKAILPDGTFSAPADFQNLSQMMQGLPGLPPGMKLPLNR